MHIWNIEGYRHLHHLHFTSCHLELLFPPDKSLTWPTLCWVFKDNYKARSNTSPPNIWKEQVREDGGRNDKQGSAYALRINREAILRKDRGRGSERKGEGREGG